MIILFIILFIGMIIYINIIDINDIKWKYKSNKTLKELGENPYNINAVYTLFNCMTIGSSYIDIDMMDELILRSFSYIKMSDENDALCETIIFLINEKKTTVTYHIAYPDSRVQFNHKVDNSERRSSMMVNVKISDKLYMDLLKKKYCSTKYVQFVKYDRYWNYDYFYNGVNKDILILLTNYGLVNNITIEGTLRNNKIGL